MIDRPFSPAAEDYRRVGTALERQGLGSDIRVLAIVSAEPGDGRTMLAANLAHSLARQGREVVLVSSDLRRPDLEKLLGLGQGPAWPSAWDDPIPAIAMLVSINDHLLVLLAGMPSKHPGELLASKRLLETIQTLRQMGIIILDTPPASYSADAITLSSVADATLFVAKSGATRMRSVQEAAGGLRRDRIRSSAVLVGTSSPIFRSSSARRPPDQPDLELDELEPPAQPRQLQFNPRPAARCPSPAATERPTAAAAATTSTPARSPTSRPRSATGGQPNSAPVTTGRLPAASARRRCPGCLRPRGLAAVRELPHRRPAQPDGAVLPLRADVCEECWLVQLERYVALEAIFTEYAYSSYSDSCATPATTPTWPPSGSGWARQPGCRAGQQRRLPAAAFRGQGGPGARDRAGPQRGRGGDRARRPHPDRVLRRGAGRPAGRRGPPGRPGGGQQRPGPGAGPQQSWPASPGCSSRAGW